MSTIAELITAIRKHADITTIITIAQQINDLNVVDKGSTPLEAVLTEAYSWQDAAEAFKILIKLKANPFFKHDGKQSVVETLTGKEHLPSLQKQMHYWLFSDKESAIFTWEKMEATQPALYAKFVAAGLTGAGALPLRAAAAYGRMDLVREIIQTVGDIQQAGDINKDGILHDVVFSACKGETDAMVILQELLKQNANPRVINDRNLSAIHYALSAKKYTRTGLIKEEHVFKVVELLLHHGAGVEESTAEHGFTPVMMAMSSGYPMVFQYLLERSNEQILNQKARYSPEYLVFQVFNRMHYRSSEDTIKLLSDLKSRSVAFDKTINYKPEVSHFFDIQSLHESYEFAENVSLLHFYVEQIMASRFNGKHLEVIQALVANGADPRVKAKYTLTYREAPDQPLQKKSEELTASEYARKLILKTFRNSSEAFPYKEMSESQTEEDFLQRISSYPVAKQQTFYKEFHNFRNLERALSGQDILPYARQPDLGKVRKKAEQVQAAKTKAVAVDGAPVTVANFADMEQRLLAARTSQDKKTWKALKKSMVDYVKTADTPVTFLEGIQQLKKQLQLHFDVVVDPKTKVATHGSLAYRFFHVFDKNKFATSWEGLRQYGLDTFGMDINTEYDEPRMGLR